mmetsp:Transcript_13574/g.31543  ORF Transcript_13574/g.31543 Transcript_13574/m.31543 type:complete len:166 (-) Transcript_13574:1961-2458(-)
MLVDLRPTQEVSRRLDFHKERVLKEFQSRVLAEEWEKYQKLVIAMSNERQLKNYNTREAVRERMTAFRQQNSAVQAGLDQQIDSLQARFADLNTEAKFDASRLEKEYLGHDAGGGEAQPKGVACLAPRTTLALCIQEKGGSTAGCEEFISAMELCVHDTVAGNKQ